jgi:hypothetical protein
MGARDNIAGLFPWPQPTSIYSSDGPLDMEQTKPFEVGGVWLRALPSGDLGPSTGRDRYKVKCLTCGEVLHPSTTSATIRCLDHLKAVHGQTYE